jgi:hypothetical protein
VRKASRTCSSGMVWLKLCLRIGGLEIVRALWNCPDTPRFIVQGIQLFGGNVSVAESGAIIIVFYVVGDGCV